MNAPTLILAIIILGIVAVIIGRGIYHKVHHKGGCGCGCSGCANASACHPKQ